MVIHFNCSDFGTFAWIVADSCFSMGILQSDIAIVFTDIERSPFRSGILCIASTGLWHGWADFTTEKNIPNAYMPRRSVCKEHVKMEIDGNFNDAPQKSILAWFFSGSTMNCAAIMTSTDQNEAHTTSCDEWKMLGSPWPQQSLQITNHWMTVFFVFHICENPKLLHLMT